MNAQIQRGYEVLWFALTHRVRETRMDEIIGNTLSEQETEMLRMRFGLTGEPPTSLSETALRLGTNDGAVRETEAVALRKLRKSIAAER